MNMHSSSATCAKIALDATLHKRRSRASSTPRKHKSTLRQYDAAVAVDLWRPATWAATPALSKVGTSPTLRQLRPWGGGNPATRASH